MHKKSTRHSAAILSRSLLALLLISIAAWLAALSFATPTPNTGTLSRSTTTVTYTDPTGAPPNLTGVALGKPNCGPTNAACSVFTLTVSSDIRTATANYDPTQWQ